MWLEGIRKGLCLPLEPIDSDAVQQAVINLGGGKHVKLERAASWWIKDYYRSPKWKIMLIRLLILIKVGGYKRLRKEALRVENKLYNMPVSCPDLMPDRYICPQLKINYGIPVSSKQLRDILLSMGCPNISSVDKNFWVIGGEPWTSKGRKDREEIIRFMRLNWFTLRVRLCI